MRSSHPLRAKRVQTEVTSASSGRCWKSELVAAVRIGVLKCPPFTKDYADLYVCAAGVVEQNVGCSFLSRQRSTFQRLSWFKLKCVSVKWKKYLKALALLECCRVTGWTWSVTFEIMRWAVHEARAIGLEGLFTRHVLHGAQSRSLIENRHNVRARVVCRLRVPNELCVATSCQVMKQIQWNTGACARWNSQGEAAAAAASLINSFTVSQWRCWLCCCSVHL